MENEQLKRNVAAIMQAFTQQEMGNKITNFNMGGLAQMLLGVIDGSVTVQTGPVPPEATEPQFPTAQVLGSDENEELELETVDLPEDLPNVAAATS